MAAFHFRAVTGDGRAIEGRIEAQDKTAALAQLRRRDHLPLAIELMGDQVPNSAAGVLSWLKQPIWQSRRVGKNEVLILTRELGVMLGAGMPLDQSLRFLAEVVERERLRELLSDLVDRLRGGASFADALEAEPEIFGPAYVSMIRAGEASGALGETLTRLVVHLDRAERLKEQVRSALVYPIALMLMAGASILILLTVVVPEFEPLFESAGAELPTITRLVIGFGDLMRASWPLIPLALIAGMLGVRRLLRTPSTRRTIDRLALKAPLFGGLIATIGAATFARSFGALLANGVALPNALAIAEGTLGNALLREAVARAAMAVKEGKGLAETLDQASVFPRLAIHLIAVGERAGRLDGMLMEAAEIFDREAKSAIERLMTLLTPALTILVGVVVRDIIGAILSAILAAYQLPL